ncbi:MAG: FecR family protein [Flavitalea sp.]
MLSSELQFLLEQYLDETISEDDFKKLWKTLQNQKYREDWFRATEGALSNEGLQGLSAPEKAMRAFIKLKANILIEEVEPVPAHQLRFYQNRFFKYAASILIIIGAGKFIWTHNSSPKNIPKVAMAVTTANEILPGGQKALLTLADGSTIVLDSVANGKIAQQGQMEVIKLSGGQLRYESAKNIDVGGEPMQLNTMSTPRGGQYQLVLPDGSKVWLNAESSITYPVAFTGPERMVNISGEVYFEVFKDKTRPFRVQAKDVQVEVLGTHFNINAYSNEGPVKTSLLEGSVKINKQVLKPGQAYLDGKIVSTNVERDVAWKNGVFNFNDQDLSQVMRQLARWYNLDVLYPKGVPKKEYGGEMGRNLNLEQVLKGLENSGVHFELKGTSLIVKP